MKLDPFLVQLRDGANPEARSGAVQQIALADRTAYNPDIVHALVEALNDDDAVVKEWATVALRKLQGDLVAQQAMWDSYEREQREAIRCCALVGLGNLGQHLSSAQLRDLYRERRERPEDLLLNFAIHWAGKAGDDPDILQALCDLQHEEMVRVSPDTEFQALTSAAALRCARHCLVNGSIDKAWLKDRGQQLLLDKLGETRMQRLIEAERAKLAQPALSPGLEPGGPDVPLVPGRALADIQDEQYAQDRAECSNVRERETRSYVRDQALAREAKKAAGYACQICRDHLPNPALSRRFVHAHHIQPLSEHGADRLHNLVVVCPNCHSRLHAGTIRLAWDGAGVLQITIGNEQPRPVVTTAEAGRAVVAAVTPAPPPTPAAPHVEADEPMSARAEVLASQPYVIEAQITVEAGGARGRYEEGQAPPKVDDVQNSEAAREAADYDRVLGLLDRMTRPRLESLQQAITNRIRESANGR
jgi:hypothetical protein